MKAPINVSTRSKIAILNILDCLSCATDII
jgi:hypothetical protein